MKSTDELSHRGRRTRRHWNQFATHDEALPETLGIPNVLISHGRQSDPLPAAMNGGRGRTGLPVGLVQPKGADIPAMSRSITVPGAIRPAPPSGGIGEKGAGRLAVTRA